MSAGAAAFDREVLVEILVYHYRVAPGKGCGCGWDQLGGSWPEHVATVYEESVTARASGPAGPYPSSAIPSDRT